MENKPPKLPFRSGGLLVQNVYVPFPEQKFSEADVDTLKRKLSNLPRNKDEQIASFQSYLKKRWTTKRITSFCRPETRRVNLFPSLVASAETWRGELYSNQQFPLGKVSWCANVRNGMPRTYSVKVSSSGSEKSNWILETTEPSLASVSDEDFTKWRIEQTLRLALWMYQQTHKGEDLPPSLALFERAWQFGLWERGRIDWRLTRKDPGGVDLSTSTKTGHSLTARLAEDGSINSVLVDEKYDAAWNKAVKEASSNIDALNGTAASGK